MSMELLKLQLEEEKRKKAVAEATVEEQAAAIVEKDERIAELEDQIANP